jgi:hypothetical protein
VQTTLALCHAWVLCPHDPPQGWSLALAPLATATTVQFEFRDVAPLNATTFALALDIIAFAAASQKTGSLIILFKNCTMKGVEVQSRVGPSDHLDTPAQLSLVPDGQGLTMGIWCMQMNHTAVVAMAGGPRSVSVKLEDTRFEGSTIDLMGAFVTEADLAVSLQVTGSGGC